MAIGEFPNQLTKMTKIWFEITVFSNRLIQHPQMIIALDKSTGYIFTSSPKYVMPSAVAMEILGITNIGSIASEKIADAVKCQIVIFF